MTQLKDITVKPILESLDFVLSKGSSVARFGDGEFDLMMGRSIPYQAYNEDLAKRLLEIVKTPSSDQLLVCLPDVFEKLERYNQNAQNFWQSHFEQFADFYEEVCQSPWYGSTFLSRPYIDLVDKSPSANYFESIRQLWQDKDILLVEGETSRSGLGNDLFANSKSLKRIICPSKNAFDSYQEILTTVRHHAENRLVILSLGPTAKLLAYDLSQEGKQAIDLGHIDSEYEWFLMKADHKIKLDHKHTAEFNYDTDILPVEDEVYESQILARVGLEVELNQDKLISVIIPVYNVAGYLSRCLDSVLKQTYKNLEILLINDGSNDGSAAICQDYAGRDSRIRVFHQDNTGVSVARNKGLQEFKGDYVTFIDSDDFIDENYIMTLYRLLLKNKADISACNFTAFDEERQTFRFTTTKDNYFETNFNRQEWFDVEGDSTTLTFVFTFSHLKLFKRELFQGLSYPRNQTTREDDAFLYKVYFRAKRISFINSGIYFYSQRSTGLSRTVMRDNIEGMVSNAEERLALMSLMGLDVTAQLQSYLKRLEMCQADALRLGQISLYQDISAKLKLYEESQNF